MTNPLDPMFQGMCERENAARVERLKALFAKAKSEGRTVTMGEYIKALEMPYLYGDGDAA